MVVALVVPLAATPQAAAGPTQPARMQPPSVNGVLPPAGPVLGQPLVVRRLRQTGRLAVIGAVVEGDSWTAKATFTPALPGRAVRLQRETGTGWRTVASGTENRKGTARIGSLARPAGTVRYRAVAVAYQGVPRFATMARGVVSIARLPRINIVTDDGEPILDDVEYSHASVAIRPRGSGLQGYAGTAKLRVRGNSTSWIRMKLPYKVKLDEAASMLGMPSAKSWVLLANFYDRSMLRNDVGFELSRRLGMPWTPRMTPVELWLNGHFQGLYQLGESIEVDADRVDITDDGSEYLLEGDTWPDPDTPAFRTGHGLQLFVKEPEDLDEASIEAIEAEVQAFEDALYSEQFTDPDAGYRPHIDVATFIDWYLTNEIMKTLEAAYLNSCWMYQDDGELHMGPVWDLDQAAGNRTNWGADTPTGWYLRLPGVGSQITGPEGHWLIRMFEDPWFEEQVRLRWAEVRTSVLALPDYVAAEGADIAGAAARNFAPEARGGAGMPIDATFLEGPDHLFQGSWGAERDYLAGWLDTRLAWIDQQLS